MTNNDFYQIISKEIEVLNLKFKHNKFLQKQDEKGKKSFGFLLWFLNRYLPHHELNTIESYITEGDDDTSCDLIFENTDQKGELVYYVVQAKWFSETNIAKTNGMTKELKACLSDFRLVLGGLKKPSHVNEKFNERYADFLVHKNDNKKIKFLYVALCKGDFSIKEHIADFVSELVSFELLDLNRLKRDYIEIEYKGIKTHNPIETPYIPQIEFDLHFVPSEFIKLDKSVVLHEAYIFLVKPLEIYRLFNSYSFSLFYKNIRNPLTKSFFNDEISNTIKNNPLYFWYFNNGITAITDQIKPFHRDSTKVTLKGIQIINGAQTVYNIYQTYHFASDIDRDKMNENGLITLRLLKTGGSDFDLKVTRYTNSQNPISERDFHSNDDVQTNLQNSFFDNTNIWYETRRSEFREFHRKAEFITNEDLGQTYLAYYLEDPFNAKQNKKAIFYSEKIYANGLYEKIFNQNTSWKDMLIAYKLYKYIEKKRLELKREINSINPDAITDREHKLLRMGFVQYASFDILALLRHVIHQVNNDDTKNVDDKLFKNIQNKNFIVCEHYYEFIVSNICNYLIELNKKDSNQLVDSVIFKQRETYGKLKNMIQQALTSEIKNLPLITFH